MQRAEAVQLTLFPVDQEESTLLAQGRLYAALPDDAKRMVRAYLTMLRRGEGCRQADWIRASGLATSTAHDTIKRHEAQLWPAIQEACQLLGVRGAQVGSLALVAAGVILFRDLVSGLRSTSSLTQVELSIMRDCAAMTGLRPAGIAAGVTVTGPDGSTLTALAGSDAGLSPSELAEGLRLLRGRMERTARPGGEAGGADSARGGDVQGVPAGAVDPGAEVLEAAGAVDPGAEDLVPAVSETVGGEVGEAGGGLAEADNGRGGSRMVAAAGAVAVWFGLVAGLSAAAGGGPAAAAGRPVGGPGGVGGAWGRAENGTPAYVVQWAGSAGKISSRKPAGGFSRPGGLQGARGLVAPCVAWVHRPGRGLATAVADRGGWCIAATGPGSDSRCQARCGAALGAARSWGSGSVVRDSVG